MEQDEVVCSIVTSGFVELVENNGIEELRVYSNLDELAKGFGIDSTKLKEFFADRDDCMAGHCNKFVKKLKNKDHKISCKAGGSCATPSECHVIKLFTNADGDVEEEDLDVGPVTITPENGTAYICRCV